MNPLEHELSYPFGQRLPAEAQRIEVAEGVHWIRMPLPFALDHINLWLLRDRFEGREGWTLIDCGIASDAIRGLWERLFADGLDGMPIVRVIATHTHPDHVGLAHMITERFACPLWMTIGEYAMGRVLSAAMPGADGSSAAAHFRRHGVPDGAQLEAIRNRNIRYFRSLVPAMPLSFRRIREGDVVHIGASEWRVIVGIGHSPEHAALYCPESRTLISGDMVLPRISTNVSVFELEPESNPVDWYLASLEKFDACAADTLVLPSHGRPFRQLHRRLNQLREHHVERLELVEPACRDAPKCAFDIVPIMFRREFDTHQLTFALGEALAHLHALWYRGMLVRIEGDDAVMRFEPSRR
ncbi:MAG: MBL fold metallo-hydrolase [Burkholderiales bacterium]|nr:MAG: MBL fold metallo-hydrolase [Burkholderiales bacterium]